MSSGVITIPLVFTDATGTRLSRRFTESVQPVSPGSHDDSIVSRPFLAGPENQLLCILEQLVDAARPSSERSSSERPRSERAELAELTPPDLSSLPASGMYPLTLCGPTGVGKSHLLHGCVDRHRTKFPAARRILVTGADFARGLAHAIEVDSVAEWRERQRDVDLLAIDDLQELTHKPSAQWELAQTLDALAEQGGQVMLSIRLAIADWTWMLPGLRSRIEGGLVLPVQPPGYETRQQIIRDITATQSSLAQTSLAQTSLAQTSLATASMPEAFLPNSVLLDPRVTLTYAQIQAAVCQQLHQECLLTGATEPLTEAPATHPLRDETPAGPQGRIHRIAKLVARQSQITLTDLRGPSRRHSTVRARATAVYLSRVLLRASFEEIGEYFGGRDHTTVLYSWRKACDRVENDHRYKHEVGKLTAALQSDQPAGPPATKPLVSDRKRGGRNKTISKFTG